MDLAEDAKNTAEAADPQVVADRLDHLLGAVITYAAAAALLGGLLALWVVMF